MKVIRGSLTETIVMPCDTLKACGVAVAKEKGCLKGTRRVYDVRKMQNDMKQRRFFMIMMEALFVSLLLGCAISNADDGPRLEDVLLAFDEAGIETQSFVNVVKSVAILRNDTNYTEVTEMLALWKKAGIRDIVVLGPVHNPYAFIIQFRARYTRDEAAKRLTTIVREGKGSLEGLEASLKDMIIRGNLSLVYKGERPVDITEIFRSL